MMAKISITEAIKRSVKEHNPEMAGRCADVLRFHLKYDYEQTFQRFNELTGINRVGFENLMFEADCLG